MTPAGDVSYSRKKHAMLPEFYSFRTLGITMIKDYSCCRLQEISGNNVVILFQRNVILLPQELTQQCKNIAEHPTTSITRV